MKSFIEKSRNNYDKIANNYDNSFDGKFTVKFKELLIKEVSISENDNVLDIGCGNGTFLNKLSKLYKINGYGSDISMEMIAEARKLNPNMFFSINECNNLLFEDNKFNVLTVCASFHHFPIPSLFAEEAYRLLKPNGKLYIAEMKMNNIIRALINPFIHLSNAGDVRIYSREEIIEIFTKVGFKTNTVTVNGRVQIVSFVK